MNLFNSFTKNIEIFTPQNNKSVKMYICGITPYDTTHLGHAFTYVIFDVLVRYLAYKGYTVTYTQNVTDIDDDILKRAKKEQRDWKELGEYWTNKFLTDMKHLNVLPPTHYVKATDSITMIIRIVKSLIKKGYAYENSGNVYFEVKKFEEYGKLSRLSTDEMIALSQERGADPHDPFKKDPLDFILWQKSRLDEPSWDSPWGPPAAGGRPGWHIECSSMIYQYLGKQIDIHGGGHDLIFPHHESEIAQSESFTSKHPFVSYWMHTAMVMFEGEKMSKSLGNLVMVSDLLKTYSANAIRYVLLSHHYKKPWEFHKEELQIAEKTMSHLMRYSSGQSNVNHGLRKEQHLFDRVLDDDLNTPQALKNIKFLSQKIEQTSSSKQKTVLQCILNTQLQVLGFCI